MTNGKIDKVSPPAVTIHASSVLRTIHLSAGNATLRQIVLTKAYCLTFTTTTLASAAAHRTSILQTIYVFSVTQIAWNALAQARNA